MSAQAFTKVLVANRGEIAARVIRSINDAGYRSVVVFSEADSTAPHVGLADEAVCIGPAQAGSSYLRPDRILEAAKRTGAEAIHPGYGFLSENAEFAQACRDAGLIFIGPSPEAIQLMGNKRVAKQHMHDAGVPCIPGYQGEDQSDDALLAEAERIGFPLMIKAAAGGGGRGMRLVADTKDVVAALASARSEAESAFGSGELILEKAVMNGRHIEIQIAADQSGQTVYLGERDCSIQRRHQKVVEEAPSPFVNEALRARMGEVAVNAALACGYCGVGTVEFLVEEDGAFYFLEMNTRLQVEHPVTELVTGTDLVDWQLKIAAGEPLPKAQEEIALSGHAIEIRLYAEDPSNGFMPQTGRIHHWEPALGAGVRVDCGIETGLEVSPYYDPMLAKVIAYGATREEARRRLVRATQETKILGVQTNKAFLGQILTDPRFVAGQATTAFIDDETLAKTTQAASPALGNVALAAVVLLSEQERARVQAAPWGWSNSAPTAVSMKLTSGDSAWSVKVNHDGEVFLVTIGEDRFDILLHETVAPVATVTLGGVRQRVRFAIKEDNIFLDAQGQSMQFSNQTYAPAMTSDAVGNGRITANMEGLVVAIDVTPGARVERGQALLTVEAMKMEHRQLADGDGVVTTVAAQVGAQVKKGQLLVEVDLDGESEGPT
ncbi:acetyl-CoA carboxylase biotin carboxylase subunit [Rhodobacteraceae bacterium D3-12]|nr:acetyl-CoA carboxylase biotin carboxylase subunit [Rhodobacteraceae bacterium D3-12]